MARHGSQVLWTIWETNVTQRNDHVRLCYWAGGMGDGDVLRLKCLTCQLGATPLFMRLEEGHVWVSSCHYAEIKQSLNERGPAMLILFRACATHILHVFSFGSYDSCVLCAINMRGVPLSHVQIFRTCDARMKLGSYDGVYFTSSIWEGSFDHVSTDKWSV